MWDGAKKWLVSFNSGLFGKLTLAGLLFVSQNESTYCYRGVTEVVLLEIFLPI